MDAIDESGYSADSSNVSSEGSVHQTKPILARGAEIITDNLHSKKPSAEIQLGASQGSTLDKTKISFSSGSRSSTDSNDTIIEPRISHVRGSEQCINDQAVQSSDVKRELKDQPYSVVSSCEVTDITQETTLMSPQQIPPLQVMDRSSRYEPGRISSSVFTANSTPQEWSLASNESLFSLHVGHIGSRNGVSETGDMYLRSSDFAISDEVMSNRTSMVVGQEAARNTVETAGKQGRPSLSDKITHDILLQKIHDLADAKARIPETSWDPRKNTGKTQPLPTSVNKKPEKPSSCCEMRSCCICSCASLSCRCCSKPKCSCCKMPSCSCPNCSLSWCCNWKYCSTKSCCSSWSCSCHKGSCCQSCSQCAKGLCCWKLFCCWNWSCCSKGSCCKPWSCCSKGSSCKPWSCCSKRSCSKPWSCCSKGSCSKPWSCCSKGSCCGSWKCCSVGSCCKSWNCCPRVSCCNSWNCCSIESCCQSWNCCSNGLCCSWKCGSCCKGLNCCSTGVSCCRSFKISLCCFPSSNKRHDHGVGLEMPHHHHKTKTLGRTGICGMFSCTGCSCCCR